MSGSSQLKPAVELVNRVRALPFTWPAEPTAAAARRDRLGTCASKHALLREDLASIGIVALPMLVVGPLVPAVLADDPRFAEGLGLPEVHECLTVLTPWAGPVRVDVTYDDVLLDHGLPGSRHWDGDSDMQLAIGEAACSWAVSVEGLRQSKERLRGRLYNAGERERRDLTLARLNNRYHEWRSEG